MPATQVHQHGDQQKWDEMAAVGFREFMHAHPSRFRRRVHRGIPEKYRWQVWKLLVDFNEVVSVGNYTELSRTENAWTEQIEMDVTRTFTDNKSFDDGKQQRLLRVLNAYAACNPEVGYCQGMNYVAGLLVLISDSEEECFGMFKCLMERQPHGLEGFYTAKLPLLRQYLHACDILLKELVPELRTHFIQEDIDPAVYLHQWFLTLFIYTFPFPMVMIIWDMIVYEGLPFVLRLAIAILQVLKESLLAMKFEDIIDFFKKLKRCAENESDTANLDAPHLGQLLIKHSQHVQIPSGIMELIQSPMPLDCPSDDAPDGFWKGVGADEGDEEEDVSWYSQLARLLGAQSSPKRSTRSPAVWSWQRAWTDYDLTSDRLLADAPKSASLPCMHEDGKIDWASFASTAESPGDDQPWIPLVPLRRDAARATPTVAHEVADTVEPQEPPPLKAEGAV
mmetsp:Transcript_51093/g.119623  ORF Transcript_51093/g.119623 Transcript_51093/m.119623 type:complete len:450 (-) Transcript_51093:39-1388(-)